MTGDVLGGVAGGRGWKGLRAFVALAGCVLAGACGREQAQEPPVAPPVVSQTVPPVAPPVVPPIDPGVLSLRDVRIDRSDPGKPMLRGKVDNASDRDIVLATATLQVLDANGRELERIVVTVDNLPPRFAWVFQAPVQGRKAASAKLVEFTAR